MKKTIHILACLAAMSAYGCDTTNILCGNGVLDDGEACDDGNAINSDGCADNCQVEDGWSCPTGKIENLYREDCVPVCGNGVLDDGEACDDGENNNDVDGPCTRRCTPINCGDGLINQNEACDSLGETASCNTNCTLSACGDSITNTASGEECDDGLETAACDANCTTAICGDGYANSAAGEECDDGNSETNDKCFDDCTLNVCGDETLNHELCEGSMRQKCQQAANDSYAWSDLEDCATGGQVCTQIGHVSACTFDPD